MTVTQFVTDLYLNEIERHGELTYSLDNGMLIVPYRRVSGALASRAGRRGKRANLACPFPAREEVFVELHELPRRSHGLLLARQFEDRAMTSLASRNGPSTTLSCPSVTRTCAPMMIGIRPPLCARP
jgi:hypothetical protein